MRVKISFVFFAWMLGASPAWALTALKGVNIGDAGRVELGFDGQIKKSQIKTEFFRDIVQVTLDDVSVYPAKITSVNQANLKKVFVYQYSPKTVRARFTVNGSAENYQDSVSVSVQGKTLLFKVDSPAASKAAPKGDPAEERALLEKIVGSAQKEKPAAKKETAPQAAAGGGPIGKPNGSSFGKMMLKVLAMLVVVLGCFGAGVLLWRKLKNGSPLRQAVAKNSGIRGILAKLIPSSRSQQMIEVVGNHYLGPKKNICVVKVQGRTLVLGVTPDSINLISQLPGAEGQADFDIEGLGVASPSMTGMIAPAAEKQNPTAEASFDQVLGQEKDKPSLGARDRIRKRLETMKPL